MEEKAFRTERVLAAAPAEVYGAFADPAKLARWWGPKGFTNTFARFEFAPGGRWVFTMHGPNGVDYANECVFRETGAGRIVIEHVVDPWFTLTVTLEAAGEGTRVVWVQEFASAKVAAGVRAIVEPANEENLDRLAGVVDVQ